jgi:uncharacterized protein YbjT (DUF2867 family)
VDRTVFVCGGTGYVGAPLVPELLARGHAVRALARPGSHRRLPLGCEVVIGDALRSDTFADAVGPRSTLIHLVGTPHPAPWKGDQFRAVDAVSFRASLAAARDGRVDHFIYVSVAHPAPVMNAYIDVRSECERELRKTGIRATVLRPWYVLGPGHRWPLLLLPGYALARRVPAFRDGATRLAPVRLADMVAALRWAVENPPERWRVLDVPAISAVRRLADCPRERAGLGSARVACPDLDRAPGDASAARATAQGSGQYEA